MVNLVTGGAGFIGSRLVNALVNSGQEVLIVDDMSTGRIRNLEHAVQTGRATLIYASAAIDFESLRELVGHATTDRIGRIFHLAPPPEATVGTAPDGLLVTLPLIELARANRARFLFATNPGASTDKRPVTAAISSALVEHGVPGSIVRVFDCYGPAILESADNFIVRCFHAAFEGGPFPIPGTGREMRSPLFVDDAVALMRAVIEQTQDGAPSIDAVAEDAFCAEEIAVRIARVANVPFEARYVLPATDPDALAARDPAAAREYGWRSETPLDSGLRATYRWLSEGRLAFA